MQKKQHNFQVHFEVEIQDNKWNKYLALIESDIQEILNVTVEMSDYNYINPEVLIILANDKELARLNYEFRGKNSPTNILSFPCFNSDEFRQFSKFESSCEILPVGEMIVSLNVLLKECEEQSKDFRDHFLHLVSHSMLHLLGYDHEEDEEAKLMESTEVKILSRFNIDSPYEY